MPSLLVLGINYAPEPISTGLNTTGLSKGLSARGWSVTVVTGYPHYPWWRVQPAPAMSTVDGVNVLRRRHYVPTRPTLPGRAAFELTWLASCLPTIAQTRSVDVVLGVVPNLGAAPLALIAARRYKAPLTLLFQDLVGRAAVQSGIEGSGRFEGLIKAVETQAARRATGVAIVAEAFREYFTDAGVDDRKIARVRNPHRLPIQTETRASVRGRMGWKEDDYIVIHTGNMGYKQALETVVEAAVLAREIPQLRFILQGDGSQRSELGSIAKRLNSPVEFEPLVSDEDYPNILRAADVAILHQRASVRNMSMPGKLGTYFAAGLPVIAGVSKEDETASEVIRSGAGEIVSPENAAEMLRAVMRLRSDPHRAAAMGESGKQYAETQLSEDSFVTGIQTFLERALE